MAVADLLADFREGMQASLAVKDNNGFWPRGIPALSFPSSHVLLDSLRSPKCSAESSLNPTSVLCLYLYLIHGVRRVQWQRDDRLRLAETLLGHVAVSRGGSLLPTGPIHLRDWKSLVGGQDVLAGIFRSDKDHLAQTFLLGGQAFALGEAVYFFCHRLLTERHGPYEISPDLAVSCRHIVNLDLCDVWPEVPRPPDMPEEVTLWSFYDARTRPVFSYDMFANPVFSFDPLTDCIGSVVYARYADAGRVRLNTREIMALRSRFEALTRAVLDRIDEASDRRLAEAMRSTMIGVAERVLKVVPGAAAKAGPLEPPFDFKIDSPLPRLVEYYDLRSSWRSTAV
ncbi:hypothetical protein [Actinoallomurus sp. CA-150999]|uniref:hypothetical protein n=1 Tax=Actinoallomurus sp. CA-150999 TaxID=3239887 RepID=UPI003D91CFAB